jgi:HSP20 family protein
MSLTPAFSSSPRRNGPTLSAATNAKWLGGWSPALDVYDGKDNFVVTLEVPGMKKEDIEISLHDGMLTVSGERKDEREQTEGQAFRSERYFGKFQRSLSLPAAVDANKVKGSYKDGVLTIHLPKAEEAKPKQIAVSGS